LVLVLAFFLLGGDQTPEPPTAPDVPSAIIGAVTLHDWPDGRRWLSWYRANRDWAGQPLWADRPHGQAASCAAFTATIVCLNLKSRARDSRWNLLPELLGTTAMLKAGLQPVSSAQPADIVNAYLLALRARGVDTWYRVGAIQSPPLIVGATEIQYYQRAQLQWPVGSRDPATIRLAPLGQLALANGW